MNFRQLKRTPIDKIVLYYQTWMFLHVQMYIIYISKGNTAWYYHHNFHLNQMHYWLQNATAKVHNWSFNTNKLHNVDTHKYIVHIWTCILWKQAVDSTYPCIPDHDPSIKLNYHKCIICTYVWTCPSSFAFYKKRPDERIRWWST